MRIDAHQHFWKFNPVRDAWIRPDMQVIRRDFFPEDLQPILQQHDIDGCVAVQADQSEAETDFLLELADRHDFIRGVVGWIDLCADDLGQRLNRYEGRHKLKGFRHIVQAEPDPQFTDRAEFRRGVRMLHEFGYTYDILIYQHQLPMALRLVEHCADQPLVVDHIAKPLIRKGEWKEWADGMRALAVFPNVMCKVSGMVTEADWQGWKPEDFKRYLDVVTEAFGTDRLMYGSDWPVCLLAADYARQLEIVSDHFGNFSLAAQSAVFGGNAVRFYRL